MRRLLPIAIAALAIAGCQQPKQLYPEHGWVRLPAVKANPAVAYFTIHGGAQDAALLSVTSPTVIRSEMHESMAHGGVMTMAPIKSISIPARGTVEFKPGGKHVMLYDVNPSVKAGDTMTLVFTFANNDRIPFDVPVLAPGDPAPKN